MHASLEVGVPPAQTETPSYSTTLNFLSQTAPQIVPQSSYLCLCNLVNNRLAIPSQLIYSLTPSTAPFGTIYAVQVAELAFDNGLKVSDSIAASLLPTPTVGHVRNHDEPVEDYLQRRQDFVDGKTKGMPGASLGVAVRMEITNDDVIADSDQKGL